MKRKNIEHSDTDGKKVAIAGHVKEILEILGLNLNDPSVAGTPMRVARMYVDEVFSSLHTPPPVVTTFPNPKGKGHYDQILVERNITINSHCEHHLVPFNGIAHVAYLPGKEVCGLSKLNRVSQYFAKKPQIQERLGTEIMEFLQTKLKTKNVAVVLICAHSCVSCRGIQDTTSDTVTSHLGGIFRNDGVRAELFNLINLGK